jgi:hypothetical protein
MCAATETPGLTHARRGRDKATLGSTPAPVDAATVDLSRNAAPSSDIAVPLGPGTALLCLTSAPVGAMIATAALAMARATRAQEALCRAQESLRRI